MKTIILTLIIYALTFGQDFLVLNDGQAELIKGRYGIYSEIDPIPTKDDKYVLPIAVITDNEFSPLVDWLEMFPRQALPNTIDTFYMPPKLYVDVGQTVTLTFIIPEGLVFNPVTDKVTWDYREPDLSGKEYKIINGEIVDSIIAPYAWKGKKNMTKNPVLTYDLPITSLMDYYKIDIIVEFKTGIAKTAQATTLLRLK